MNQCYCSMVRNCRTHVSYIKVWYFWVQDSAIVGFEFSFAIPEWTFVFRAGKNTIKVCILYGPGLSITFLLGLVLVLLWIFVLWPFGNWTPFPFGSHGSVRLLTSEGSCDLSRAGWLPLLEFCLALLFICFTRNNQSKFLWFLLIYAGNMGAIDILWPLDHLGYHYQPWEQNKILC